jgi:hypothetical protein
VINILFVLLLSFPLWAKLDLELVTTQTAVKQGEILEAKVVIRPVANQNMVFPPLSGKKINNTVYFLSASPLLGKEGQGFYESDVKVIFLKVPESPTASEVINGEEIQVHIGQIQVSPTETQQSFLLGDFEIPFRRKYLPWILSALGALLLGVAGFLGWKWMNRKTQSKSKLRKLKNEIVACKSYEEVVLLWRNKRTYLQVFPEIQEPFQTLEEVLFKYQFKATRTESELEEVMAAYKEFSQKTQGVLGGI